MLYDRRLCTIMLGLFLVSASAADAASTRLIVVPLAQEDQIVLTPLTLGVIVNLNDPNSIALAEHYSGLRGIPRSNIIGLTLPRANFVSRHLMSEELKKLKASPSYARFAGFVLAFDRPYRVDGNQSITSAVSQGLANVKWSGNCNLTSINLDRGSPPGYPMTNKPAMMLTAGANLQESISLADRGKGSDATDPDGEVIFFKTDDKARSIPREPSMDRAKDRLGTEIDINVITENLLATKKKIIAFETGLSSLANLESLEFFPGGYADHLTSFGGRLYESRGQTSIIDIIRAGATASYGTVREPCNFPEKFPDPEEMLSNYLSGESLLEAYWKSVSMLTEGLLVGEPLARPFPVLDAQQDGSNVTLRVNRHTLRFITSANQIRNASITKAASENQEHLLGLYSVNTGKPHLIKHIRVSSAAKPGDLIGTLILSDEAEGVMLGVAPI